MWLIKVVIFHFAGIKMKKAGQSHAPKTHYMCSEMTSVRRLPKTTNQWRVLSQHKITVFSSASLTVWRKPAKWQQMSPQAVKWESETWSLMYHEHGFWKKVFVFFKEKVGRSREDGTDMSVSGISLRSVHVHFCLLSLSSLQLAWYSQQESGSERICLSQKGLVWCFPCKPNILTGSEVEDRHNREGWMCKFIVQRRTGSSPKLWAASKSHRTSAEAENVRMWMKEMLTSFINLCICLPKADN